MCTARYTFRTRTRDVIRTTAALPQEMRSQVPERTLAKSQSQALFRVVVQGLGFHTGSYPDSCTKAFMLPWFPPQATALCW